MWTRSLAVLLALVLIAGTAMLGPEPAWANKYKQKHDYILDHDDEDEDNRNDDETLNLALSGESPPIYHISLIPLVKASTAGNRRAAISRPIAAIYQMINLTATLQPGERTEGGLMTRTVWAGFKAEAAARIVVHTYGSTDYHTGSSVFDTVLAVYRGTALDNLVRIAGNDNRPLPGISTKHSLVQFNTVAGTDYRVQIGSRAQAEGDISLNVFRFPPSGGLAAFLIHYDGNTVNPFNGRDYICDIYVGGPISCPSAKFLVHNSTNGPLNVTASSTLGAGVAASPASFILPKGGLNVVNFAFGPTFNRTTVRTATGHFILTGRSGGAVVAEARHRALVIARPGNLVTDLIRARAIQQVQTAHVNEPTALDATVTNTGAQTAIGCHFRSKIQSDLKTTFYTINPANGQRLSADNVPLNIAPGQSRTFKVTFASQGARDADFIDPEVIADCANNQRRSEGVWSGFDISASGYYAPLPSIAVTSQVPSNGVLNVPPTGFAYYTFRAKNTQTTESLDVLPYYIGPFDDPANSNYPAAICRTNLSTGRCLAPYASSLTYTATKNAVVGFSVRVKAPVGAPPFNPDQRRVYVHFKLTDVPYFRIAAPSIAVKRQ